MNKEQIVKQLRNMAKHPTVTLPKDCEALKAAAELIEQAQKQEPVAWAMLHDNGDFIDAINLDEHARIEGDYTHPLYTSPPQRQPLTDRDNAIIRFAVHQFMSDAYARLNAAAQDKDNRHFRSGAVDAFAKDAKDAEVLLAKLPATHGIKGEA